MAKQHYGLGLAATVGQAGLSPHSGNGMPPMAAPVLVTEESPPRDAVRDLLAAHFDARWYLATYRAHLPSGISAAGALDHYLARGARLGHNPNDGFCEIAYRTHYSDVRAAILAGHYPSGFAHYVSAGLREGRRHVLPDPASMDEMIEMYHHVDAGFIRATYMSEEDVRNFVSPYDYYFQNVTRLHLSPNERFSEASYLYYNPDVKEAVEAGKLMSGLHHFVRARETHRSFRSHHEFIRLRTSTDTRFDDEGQALLRDVWPDLGEHVEFAIADDIRRRMMPVHVDPVPVEGKCLLVVVPHFFDLIMFGGYLTYFRFVAELVERTGCKAYLLVTDGKSEFFRYSAMIRMRTRFPEIVGLFEAIHFLDDDRVAKVPADCEVISYCADTHYVASFIARRQGRAPIFFIQEHESCFHPEGSFRAYIDGAFMLDHVGIYNTGVLADYFRNRTGVFEARGEDYRWACIENAVTPLGESREEFAARTRRKPSRKLIVYARPEGHAARNQLATAILGLELAVIRGLLDPTEWEIIGIGALNAPEPYRLATGAQSIRFVSRLPKDEYEALLREGDVGISLISSPHPGLIHFQMAAFGLLTLTNVTADRSAQWLSGQSGNLIGVQLTPESIARGIAAAVGRVGDLDARFDGARAMAARNPDDGMGDAIRLVGGLFAT